MRTASISRVAAVVLAVAACSHAQKKQAPTTVSQADLGRLSPDQMAPIDAGRADLAASRDALARAQLRAQEAKHEEDFARAEQTSAQGDGKRAAAEAKAAGDAGDPGWAARAQEMTDAAKLRQSAADAHLTYAQRLVQARNADVQAAEAAVNVSNAELERARLGALQQAQIPAASKYDPAPFDAQVAKARRAEEDARARAGKADQEATAARGQWQALQQRWEARAEGQAGRG